MNAEDAAKMAEKVAEEAEEQGAKEALYWLRVLAGRLRSAGENRDSN